MDLIAGNRAPKGGQYDYTGSSPPESRGRAAITIAITFAVIWIVQFVNVGTGSLLDADFGIRAHVLTSLPDIFSAPFLHASWAHIEGNSLPLLILGFLAAYRGLAKFALVSVTIIFIAGLFVWLVSPTGTDTIGASAVIAGWLGYVMLRGIFDHRLFDIIVGAVAALMYLGAFDLLPNNAGISWQGHLSGLLTGMLCAWLFRTRTTPVKSTGPPKTIQSKADHSRGAA